MPTEHESGEANEQATIVALGNVLAREAERCDEFMRSAARVREAMAGQAVDPPTCKQTNDLLRAAMNRGMRDYHEQMAKGHTCAGMLSYMAALRARNDLVDRGVICDRCEGELVDGRCASCDARAG